jgi:hypothetical protein
MGTNYASKANWNITMLAMNLTYLIGVNLTFRKIDVSVLEWNNIMW